MIQVIDFIGGEYENRTHVHGFAIRCVTTPPTRRHGCDRPVSLGLQYRDEALPRAAGCGMNKRDF